MKVWYGIYKRMLLDFNQSWMNPIYLIPHLN